MLILSFAIACALALALVGWLAVALFHASVAVGVVTSLVAPLPVLVIVLVRWWRSRRRKTSDPELVAVEQAWADVLAAAGEDASPARPWWLLLGASGCGKTTLLTESGVAWITRPVAGEAQRGPRLWRSDAGCILELPGTWADGRRMPPAWIRLLALLKARRGARAVQGVVACVAAGDLLRRGPLATAVTAQSIRDRGEELAAALGAAAPLHLVLTKADQIGGCKDFFAAASREERGAELGAALPWPPPDLPLAAWRSAHERLVTELRDRRLAVLPRCADDVAAAKAFQFPLQLAAAAGPIGELLGHLIQPGGRESLPLRAVHLTSGLRPARPAQAPLSPAERTDFNASVYAGARRSSAGDAGGQALFARDLFQRVLPASAHAATPTRRAGRLARRIRRVCLAVVPLCAIAVGLWITAGTIRRVILVGEVRTLGAEARAVERSHPDDRPRNLDALDRFAGALADLASAGTSAQVLEPAGMLYNRLAGRLHVDRAVAALVARINDLRQRSAADPDALYDAFRAYQMLAGAVPVDPVALEAALSADRRWFLALEDGGVRLDWPTEVLARRQLERHIRDLLPLGLGRIQADRSLVEGAARELGETLWIRLGLEDVLRGARGQFPRLTAGHLGAAGPLALVVEVDGALTREAWERAVSDLVDEKAVGLARTLDSLGAARPESELRRRLAEGFAGAHRRAWLAALAGARTVPAADPDAVPRRVDEITGSDSPWPAFVKRVVGELDLRTSGVKLGFAPGVPWAQPALAGLQPLAGDVRAWLLTQPAGARLADLDKVLALARRFDEAYAAASAAVTQVQPDDVRDALRASLAGLVHGLWQPIDQALAAEIDRDWQARVVPVWQRELAGRYPFAAATVVDEIPLEVFARFANPVDGTLWAGLALPERLRAQLIAGRPALTVSPAYAALVQRAQEIRSGFFVAGVNRVEAAFTVVLVQREGVADLTLACGAQTVRFYDRPDARYPLILRQSESPGARIAVKVVTGEWKAREFSTQPWALLRLIQAGDPRPGRDGGWTLTWPFAGTAAGGEVVWRAQAILEPGVIGRAAAGDLFLGFQVPDRIGAE
jgi:type VI protein secretion system component VasK